MKKSAAANVGLLSKLLLLTSMERKWLLPLLASSLISISLFLAATFSLGASSTTFHFFLTGAANDDTPDMYVESKLSSQQQQHHHLQQQHLQQQLSLPADLPKPPRLAYLISGTKGDGDRMLRLLRALYHPRNHYLLHLDLEAPPRERVELARYVRQEATFTLAGNVHVVGKANLVTYRGSTMTACTLHAAAILLRQSKDWDWFINLSASDYPLVTQDDLLHVLSYLPRDLNFLEHTSDIGWKEFQRAKPIIIDPGLYMNKKTDIFWVTQRRSVPTAFKLFTGSAWVALTRNFVEFCIWGWDNLPRTVLMYYSNFLSSPEGYFHTVICNAREFRNTTVNHDLHYITWDNPPKQHPLSLTLKDFDRMNASGAPFARKFDKDDPVLDKIDSELLGRQKDSFTPGGWCLASVEDGKDPCSRTGDADVLRPGLGAKRFEALVLKLLSPQSFRANQCVFH